MTRWAGPARAAAGALAGAGTGAGGSGGGAVPPGDATGRGVPRLGLAIASAVLILVGLGVASLAPSATPSRAVVAAVAVALGGVWVLARVRRTYGTSTAWLAAVSVSILAGELSAVSLGGQSGRVLWTDAVVLGGVAMALLRRPAVELPREAVLGWTAALVAWSALTLPITGDPLTAIAELKEWIVALVAGVAAYTIVTDVRRARAAFGAVAVTGAAIGALMLIIALRSPLGPVLAILLKQVDLPWGRSNYLAGILILSLSVALGLAASSPRWRARLAWTGCLGLCALGLVLSASKGAIVALVAGLLVAYVPAGRASRVGIAALAVLLVAGVALFVAGPLHEVLAYRTQQSALSYSVGERWDLYALAWNRYLHAPLVGVGLNNFSVAAHRLTGVDTVPHNFELGFLVELGPVGLAIAVAWMVAALALARRAARNARGPDRALAIAVASGIVGFAVHNQIESTIYGEQYKVLLFVVLAGAAALARSGLPRGDVPRE